MDNLSTAGCQNVEQDSGLVKDSPVLLTNLIFIFLDESTISSSCLLSYLNEMNDNIEFNIMDVKKIPTNQTRFSGSAPRQ